MEKISIPEVRIGWSEVAAAIFQAQGISSGLWKIGVGLRFAAANAGPSIEQTLPTGIVAIESIVLTKVTEKGPLVFDAGQLHGTVGTTQAQKKKSRRKA